MEFVPDRKVLMNCVLKIEGLTDSTGVRIRRVDIQDDVPIHTNNTSKVVKARIEYEVRGEVKMASLAVKIPFLRTKVVYEFFKGLQFFVKEARFYKSLVPRMQKMLQSEIAPTLFASDEQQVLFLDDLSAQGYRVQVEGQLDAEHSAVVLQHLARMHASSHVLHREDPRSFDDPIKQQFLIGDDFIGNSYLEVKPLLGALARVRCLSQETVERFESAVEKARVDIASNLGSSRFGFCVLNHGDLKAHNILFKYDERCRPVRCSLIDFQVCHWSSPALDIVFFTIQSVERRVYARNFDRLLDIYVSTLNSTLAQLNCGVRLTGAQLRHNIDNVKAFKISSFLFRTLIDIREFSKDFEYAKSEEASPELIDQLSQSVEIQDRVRFWLEEFEKSEVI